MSTRDPALPSRSKRTGRVAARIAWRTALRHPGRSVLIASLVALPTIGLTAGTVLIASTVPTTDEELEYSLGETEAWIQVLTPPDPSLEQSPFEPMWTRADWMSEGGTPQTVDPDDAGLLSPDEVLPAGTRILSTTETTATVRTDAGIAGITVIEGDAGDPSLTGRYDLTAGRTPTARDEIALSSAALAELGVRVGDVLRIVEPRAVSATVVGTIEDRARGQVASVLFARDGALTGIEAAEQPSSAVFYLPDTSLDWGEVRELNRQGMVAYSREVIEHPPAPGEYGVGTTRSWTDALNSGYISLVLLLGGFAVFQVCLLAGAAFVVGMRADQRALATIASVGGEPRLIARIVSMGGVVLGGVGGLVGLGLGTLAAWDYYVIADDGNAVTLPGFHPWPPLLVGVLGIAVLAGWIAALAAARGARRIDVVAALRGARRPRPARRRRAVAGVVVALVGAGVLAAGGILAVLGYWPEYNASITWLAMATLVAGAVGLQLGLTLATPALLGGTARILSRVSEGARLASRDASRNHARSVPAAAAVMSTVFVAVFLMTYLSSGQKTLDEGWTYEGPQGTVSASLVPSTSDGSRAFPTADQVDDMRELFAGVLDAAEVPVLDAVLDPSPWAPAEAGAEWTTPRYPDAQDCGTGDNIGMSNVCVQTFPQMRGVNEHLYVGDASDLAVILGHEPSEEAARMLERGGAIAFWPGYLDDGEVTLDTWSDEQVRDASLSGQTAERSESVPAVYVDPGVKLYFGVLLARDTADALGLDYGPARILVAAPDGVSDQQYQALWAGMPTIIENTSARYEAGPPQMAEGFAWAMLGLTALITFASAAVAIGLARADGRRDEEVLDAIGAPPRLRRAVAFWQAIVVAGIGTLLGAAVGVLPVLALALATQLAAAQGGWTGGGPLQDFAPPWLQLGLTVVGVPLAIAIGSWTTAGRRRVAVRRAA